MRWYRAAAVSLVFVLGSGCSSGQVQEVPITLRYTPVEKIGTPPRAKTVALGAFLDVRTDRTADLIGERVRISGSKDHFKPQGGVPGAVAAVVRGYFLKRGAQVRSTDWDGSPAKVWSQPGDLAVSGRVTRLWFAAKDLYTQAEASTIFRVELIVGSPQSGTVITKSIQIEPAEQRNLYWNTHEIEEWISRTVSEAVERVLPDIERRLVG